MYRIGDKLISSRSNQIVMVTNIWNSSRLKLIALTLMHKNGKLYKNNDVILEVEYINKNYKLLSLSRFNKDLVDLVKD